MTIVMMLQPVLAQAARDLLRTLGMWLLAQGVLTSANQQAFIGACMTLLGILWGWLTTKGYIEVGALLKRATGASTVADAKAAAQLGPRVRAAAGSLLLVMAVTLAWLAAGHPAKAQGGKAAPKAPVTKAAATANPLLVLQTFTAADLQAALADATANNDPVAAACYSALLPVVQKGIANPLPTGLGAFQALQKARDAKALLASIQSPNGPLAGLDAACAPLVLDVQTTLVQLGIVSGAVAASGGLTLPFALPALGGL